MTWQIEVGLRGVTGNFFSGNSSQKFRPRKLTLNGCSIEFDNI